MITNEFQNETTVIDGYIVTPDGEIVGVKQDPFADERDALEWMLKKRAEANAEIASVEAKFGELIKGLQERMERLVGEQKRRIAYLDYAYGPMMQKYLEANRGKQKSVALDWGIIGTRKSSKLEILDQDALIEWAEKECPDAVKYSRSILKSELPEDAPFTERIEKDELYVKH
jgi:hypothetical protein